jgi:hypothetical protein
MESTKKELKEKLRIAIDALNIIVHSAKAETLEHDVAKSALEKILIKKP